MSFFSIILTGFFHRLTGCLYFLFIFFFSLNPLHLHLHPSILSLLSGYGGLGLSIEGPSKVDINCEDVEDGTCKVTYCPTEPGNYIINIKFADQHVPGTNQAAEDWCHLWLIDQIWSDQQSFGCFFLSLKIDGSAFNHLFKLISMNNTTDKCLVEEKKNVFI